MKIMCKDCVFADHRSETEDKIFCNLDEKFYPRFKECHKGGFNMFFTIFVDDCRSCPYHRGIASGMGAENRKAKCGYPGGDEAEVVALKFEVGTRFPAGCPCLEERKDVAFYTKRFAIWQKKDESIQMLDIYKMGEPVDFKQINIELKEGSEPEITMKSSLS